MLFVLLKWKIDFYMCLSENFLAQNEFIPFCTTIDRLILELCLASGVSLLVPAFILRLDRVGRVFEWVAWLFWNVWFWLLFIPRFFAIGSALINITDRRGVWFDAVLVWSPSFECFSASCFRSFKSNLLLLCSFGALSGTSFVRLEFVSFVLTCALLAATAASAFCPCRDCCICGAVGFLFSTEFSGFFCAEIFAKADFVGEFLLVHRISLAKMSYACSILWGNRNTFQFQSWNLIYSISKKWYNTRNEITIFYSHEKKSFQNRHVLRLIHFVEIK